MTLARLATRRSFSTASIHVPIVIVGGGPVGLFLSSLLSTYGTPSLLLEARSESQLFAHPQAHFLNTRTMEIMRHALPKLYSQVCHAMPPVEEWRYFNFGYSVAGEMARVAHPVDQPLDANRDANGTLLPKDQIYAEPTAPPTNPMSICSVGHLAQNVFSKLLYEVALELLLPESDICLESPIVDITWDNGMYKLTKDSGSIVYADVVVAADGSHSKTRQAWNIDWGTKGQEGMQHLINVHIRTSASVEPFAMLYAIYNDECVAMMVRHSATEYVLQVPYFPPYQSVERHFTHERVTKMLEKIMNTSDFRIVSIRPWTMSALVASRYTDGNAGVLVGDAAHVFPPAGGFGMNTGIQDAFSLAWRLAAVTRTTTATGVHNHSATLRQHLQEYQSERHPIARDNAALSVRNFERVLKLAKSCYLNDQHPLLLSKILDRMPLPLEVRQDMFSGLLRTALAPLQSLREGSNLYSRHVTSQLRSILQQGGGLPLLFPKYELEFGYEHGRDVPSPVGQSDTLAIGPRVQVGHLLPHVSVQVISGISRFPNLQIASYNRITTTDLPSQMRHSGPCFVLVVMDWDGDVRQLKEFVEWFYKSSGLRIEIAHIVKEPIDSDTLVLLDDTGDMYNLTSGLILVRPDGHIAYIGHSLDQLRATKG